MLQHKPNQETNTIPRTEKVQLKYVQCSYLFHIEIKVLARTIRQLKEIKGMQIIKGRGKISLFVDVTIVYIQTLNIPSETLTDVKHLQKTSTIPKPVTFLYDTYLKGKGKATFHNNLKKKKIS